jgi:uncharacterized protein DUF4735
MRVAAALVVTVLSAGCRCDEAPPAPASSAPSASLSVTPTASAEPSAAGARKRTGTSGATRGGATATAPVRQGPPPSFDDAFGRALGWLETAGELGVDTLVFAEAAGQVAEDSRASLLTTHRRGAIGADELAGYGKLLGRPKSAFPATSLDGVRPSDGEPEPTMPAPQTASGGSLIETCLRAAVACNFPAECVTFASAADRWGYVLAHQGTLLLLARWSGCSPPFEAEARRRSIGANLVKEASGASELDDLQLERLAVLGHLGFAQSYTPAWIEAVRAAQDDNGCWRVAPGQPCSAHATALALLVLAHAHRERMF